MSTSSFVEDLEWKVNSLCCEEHEKSLSLELVPWYDPPLCTYIPVNSYTCLPVDTRVGYTVTNVGALPIYRTYLECSAKRAHTPPETLSIKRRVFFMPLGNILKIQNLIFWIGLPLKNSCLYTKITASELRFSGSINWCLFYCSTNPDKQVSI